MTTLSSVCQGHHQLHGRQGWGGKASSSLYLQVPSGETHLRDCATLSPACLVASASRSLGSCFSQREAWQAGEPSCPLAVALTAAAVRGASPPGFLPLPPKSWPGNGRNFWGGVIIILCWSCSPTQASTNSPIIQFSASTPWNVPPGPHGGPEDQCWESRKMC